MAKRKAYAPFSLTSEAGVGQTPVEGYIDVEQKIYPTVQTGVVNENGKWVGVQASDSEFIGFSKDLLVSDGASIVTPTAGPLDADQYIDMTGFSSIFIAIKPSNTGNYKIEAVMGPNTYPFANLNPVVGEAPLKKINIGQNAFAQAVDDSAENLANAWNIFAIYDILKDQKMMNFRLTNNSGGDSDIEFAYMRLV
tara:strand:- start:1209 stop:1793 length:585 start_codon:yes stop_codon:yes gene_type:complete